MSIPIALNYELDNTNTTLARFDPYGIHHIGVQFTSAIGISQLTRPSISIPESQSFFIAVESVGARINFYDVMIQHGSAN
jgi:hypothetical protein